MTVRGEMSRPNPSLPLAVTPPIHYTPHSAKALLFAPDSGTANKSLLYLEGARLPCLLGTVGKGFPIPVESLTTGDLLRNPFLHCTGSIKNPKGCAKFQDLDDPGLIAKTARGRDNVKILGRTATGAAAMGRRRCTLW